MPIPGAKFGACRQQSRSAKTSSRPPLSWCVAFLHHPPGMISCIASAFGKKSTLGSRTSALAASIRTRRFGRNSRRDDYLVLRSTAVASCDSTLHRSGFPNSTPHVWSLVSSSVWSAQRLLPAKATRCTNISRSR